MALNPPLLNQQILEFVFDFLFFNLDLLISATFQFGFFFCNSLVSRIFQLLFNTQFAHCGARPIHHHIQYLFGNFFGCTSSLATQI